MRKLLHRYTNGNYKVLLYDDGTKIRFNNLDTLEPDFPESLDVSITTKCDGGCQFCYLNCGPDGKHADLNLPFFDSLRPGTELALNGNDLSHPDLIRFLMRMRKQGVVCNLTVNQRHLLQHISLLKSLYVGKLVYGLGVSLTDSSDPRLYEALDLFPNAVVHTIAGLLTERDVQNMADKNIKLLILGYKILGRGDEYYTQNREAINTNIQWLAAHIMDMREHFQVISFDNLSLDQLDMQSKIEPDVWTQSYMGDEGSFTMYVDAVNCTYARSSLEKENNFQLRDNIDDMFSHIRSLEKEISK